MNRAERRRQQRQRSARAGTGAAAAQDRVARWLPPFVIAAAGAAAYVTGLDGAFVLDDVGHILDTTRIRDLGASFTGTRPVVNFTLAINYALGGLETRGYHLLNVAVHLLAGLVLFGVVRRTLVRLDRPSHLAAAAPWLALATALLWTVHPLQTQSVTYVIQRGEAMMGLFYLLTLYAFIRGATGGRAWWWFGTAIAACALGMACKAVMVTAPFMVLLYDVIFVAGSWGQALRRRWMVHAGLAATWIVLLATGVLRIFDPGSGGEVGFGVEAVTWLEYARTQPEIVVHYVRLAAWPAHLCLDYMWPVQERWGVFAATGGVLAIVVLTSVVLVLRRRPLGYLGAWFFAILAPTSSVIPIADLAFEHRMYLPLAALAVAFVLAIDVLARFVAGRSGAPDGTRRLAVTLVVALIAGALVVRTAVRNRDYASPLRMWRSVVEQRPLNDRAHQNVASALLTEGRVDEAERYARRAIELNPANANAHVNLGTISMQRGRPADAIASYEAAIRAEPGNAAAHNNLGSLYAIRGDMGRAYSAFAEAVRIDPASVPARFSLGRVLEMRGDRTGALREYRAVLELDPSHQGALARVGVLGD